MPAHAITRNHAAERAARTSTPDAESAEILVDFLRPVVTRRVLRVLHASGADAELDDLVQDLFVWLLSDDRRVLRLWRPEKGLSLRNFVGMICERRIRAQLRTRARASLVRFEHDTDGVELPTPESQVLAQEALSSLFANLQTSLTPLGMQVFLLVYVREESVDAVSEALAMSPEAVYAWRRRLKRRLESLIQKRQQRDSVSDLRGQRPIPKRA